MNSNQLPFNMPAIGPMGVEHPGSFTGMTPIQQAMLIQQEQEMLDNMTTPFDVEIEQQFATGGGIPERYKNMGFSKVGAKKKSTRPGKKWMVLAKKGDQYKVVHGGDSKMQDFKQHGSAERKKRFWDRMGGRDSAKAQDPFSPLYWHKKFGTWQEGGQPNYVDLRSDPSVYLRSGDNSLDWNNRSYGNQPWIQIPSDNVTYSPVSGTPSHEAFWEPSQMRMRMDPRFNTTIDSYGGLHFDPIVPKQQVGGQWFNEDSQDFYKNGGWIQDAVDRMKAKGTVGSFTEQAKRAGFDSALAYAKYVKKNPGKVSDTTKKRAQFVLNTSKAAYGMEVPKHQGFGPSQVSSTSGMGNVFMQDLYNPFAQMTFPTAPAATAAPETSSPIAASYFNRIPTTSGMGNAYFQDLQMEELLNDPYGAYRKNVEAAGLPSQEIFQEKGQSNRFGDWWDRNGALAVDTGIGMLSAYAKRVNNRRLEPWFNNSTAADNIFASTPQGINDRGDYDVNTGQFRMDQQGFKNDEMYANPYVYVPQRTMYAQDGGGMAIADDDIIAEFERLGIPFEIVD